MIPTPGPSDRVRQWQARKANHAEDPLFSGNSCEA